MEAVSFWAEVWGRVFQASWQGAALALAVAGLQAAFGRRLSAGWRYALWLPVVVRLAVPATPESPWSLFNLNRAWTPKPVARTVRVTTSAAPSDSLAQLKAGGSAKPQAPQIPAAMDRSAPRPAGFWLALLWLAGAAVPSLRLLRSYALFSRGLRDAEPVRSARVRAIWEACAREARVGRLPLLLETGRVESPALFGFMRPRLLLPKGMVDAFEDAELRHVFRHELAHLKRGDVPMNWLLVVLQLLHWFNPAVWLAFARIRADRELACDALALSRAGEGENESYGQTIIKLMAGLTPRAASPGLVGIMEDKTQIKTRIAMVARHGKRSASPILGICLVALLGLVGLSDAQTADRSARVPEPKVAPPRDAARAANPSANSAELGATLPIADTASREPSESGVQIQTNVVPYVTYGFDKSFVEHFGTNGVAAVVEGLAVAQADANTGAKEKAPAAAPDAVYTRTFKVNTEQFMDGVFKALGRERKPDSNLPSVLRDFFKAIGADFVHPVGEPDKALLFNDRTGVLFVRATLRDLDVMESAISALNATPPQVTVEAKVVEIFQSESKTLGFDWFLGNTKMEPGATSTAPGTPGVFPGASAAANAATPVAGPRTAQTNMATLSGILSDPQYRMVVQALERRQGTEILAVPRVTTVSGRQARVSIDPGPSVDITPVVGADGYSVELAVNFTWDKPVEAPKPPVPPKRGDGPVRKEPAPKTKRLSASTRAIVWDGQTLVVGLEIAQEKNGRKQTMLFITPTIVDPAGNRVHAVGEGPNQPKPYDPTVRSTP